MAAQSGRGKIRRIPGCLMTALRACFAIDRVVICGHLAFTSLLAFIPFTIFLVALAGWVGQGEPAALIIAEALAVMPPAISQLLERPLYDALTPPSEKMLAIMGLIAFSSASSGVEAIRISVDRAFGMKQRRAFLHRRLQSALLVVLSPGAMIVVLSLTLLLPPLLDQGVMFFGLEPRLAEGHTALRFAIAGAILFLASYALYLFLPAVPVRFAWTWPGAAAVAGLWLIACQVFPYAFGAFVEYELIYGGLAGTILSLLFFYMSAAIFVFGAELNAAIAASDREAERQIAAGSKAFPIV